MANYLTIQEVVVAEKWTGANFQNIFEYLEWQSWSKLTNSASGLNFVLDNSELDETIEGQNGGDGILYVKVGIVMTPVPFGDYIIKKSDGSFSIENASVFQAKYQLAD